MSTKQKELRPLQEIALPPPRAVWMGLQFQISTSEQHNIAQLWPTSSQMWTFDF